MGIDCALSKGTVYDGVQMLLMGSDDNMNKLTLVCALVPAEDGESYRWFFSVLLRVGMDFTGVPVFCDRNTALLFVADDFGLELRYCTLHIIRNFFHRSLKFMHAHKNLIWQIHSARIAGEHNSGLAV